ncbi:(d)CMP kinase [Flavobacteriaceae bacterium Ap0902]|nr:(d)CMP kinase [Flavobacteriaceae bacterium Ap0902]
MHKIIAIDGHSSTGKSSLSKQISKQLGFIHIDTGAMYRAITLFAMRHGFLENGEVDKMGLIEKLDEIDIKFDYNAATEKNEIILNGENVEKEIRTMEVSNNVSPIAKIDEVRTLLVKIQRALAQEDGIVMDGRDIGTVVFPDAPVKIFLTASAHVRAQRRYDELKAKGVDVTLEEVTANVNARDKMDSERANSPLKKAEDAVEVNNDDLNAEETVEAVLKIIKEKLG